MPLLEPSLLFSGPRKAGTGGCRDGCRYVPSNSRDQFIYGTRVPRTPVGRAAMPSADGNRVSDTVTASRIPYRDR